MKSTGGEVGECGHVKIQLLMCKYMPDKMLYNITKYFFCNNCNMKMGEKVEYIPRDFIPDETGDGVITKVICNVLSNGYEYEWFGHVEDRDNYLKNGDKWE